MKAVRYVVASLGMLLLLVALPFYLASGLMAPMWFAAMSAGETFLGWTA